MLELAVSQQVGTNLVHKLNDSFEKEQTELEHTNNKLN